MQYTMLLWPHANARYQNASLGLARAELVLMLDTLAPGAQIHPDEQNFLPAIRFDTDCALDPAAIKALSRHSLLYGLFETRPDGALFPLTGRAAPIFGGDLPGILKYKGKTNELFCELLINVAYYCAGCPENPTLFDPMCGRATALFAAMNRGISCTGTDIDRNDLREAENYFKRYLEYHRFKHATHRGSMTIEAKKSAPYMEFSVRPAAHEALSLRLMELDATRVNQAFRKEKFSMIITDLPYGVQHSANVPLEKLLIDAFCAWRAVLSPGGAVAVSFNCQTLSTKRVRTLLKDAGFTALSGGVYDAFPHWVEQAVTRDIAVGLLR